MSRLLICGFGSFPRAPVNPAALAVERLMAEDWAPAGAEASYAVTPTVWSKAPEAVLHAVQASAADAVLLIGVAVEAQAFRVETQAQNRADHVQPDAEDQLWPQALIEPHGPAQRPVGAPARAMRSAIAAAGLPAILSGDAGDYLCNFTLYRVLALDPMTGFLHVPAVGLRFALTDICTAVRAAATAFAAQLV
jgi:pyroglutamyl-peptidase